jgi:uncharacterized protein (TIGR02996 family)
MQVTLTAPKLPLDHPEFGALWARVQETPADSAPLLVAADWLDEHGEPELALACRARRDKGVPVGPLTVRFAYGRGPYSQVMNSQGRPTRTHSYSFRSWQQAVEYVARCLHGLQVRAAAKAADKDAAEGLKAAFVNPYAVGDLLYHSWGYDETHYDFAQVVAVGPRSVTIRRITSRVVGADGFSGRNVEPVRDGFLAPRGDAGRGSYGHTNNGDRKVVAIQFRVRDGKMTHYLPKWSAVEDRERFYDTSGSR